MKFNMTIAGLSLFFVALNVGCAEQILPMKLVYSANNCVIEQKAITKIRDKQALVELFRSRSRLFPFDENSTPSVDFSEQQLILVAAGRKPTNGYRIEWLDTEARVKNGKLFLPVRIITPPEKTTQAQVFSSPCQIISIPKRRFDTIVMGGLSGK